MSRLSNADFRAIIATPRVNRDADAVSAPAAATPARSQLEKPKKEKKYFKPRKQPKQDEQEKPKYRDRAKERREGKIADDLMPPPPSASGGLLSTIMKPDGATNNISIEQSKLLGGDMEHTHLVKGLDYALLQKVRSEIAKKETEEKVSAEGQQQQQPAGNPKKGVAATTTTTTTTGKLKQQAVETDEIHAQSQLGKKINKFLQRQEYEKNQLMHNHVVEVFLPKRMSFIYKLNDAAEGTTSMKKKQGISDIPTIIMRSKADCPPVPDRISPAVSADIMKYIRDIMTEMREGSKAAKKKLKKKKQEAAAAAAAKQKEETTKPTAAPPTTTAAPRKPMMIDDDEDIFDDAGDDFVCVPEPKAAPVPAPAPAPVVGLDYNVPRPPASPPTAPMAGLEYTVPRPPASPPQQMELEYTVPRPPPSPPLPRELDYTVPRPPAEEAQTGTTMFAKPKPSTKKYFQRSVEELEEEENKLPPSDISAVLSSAGFSAAAAGQEQAGKAAATAGVRGVASSTSGADEDRGIALVGVLPKDKNVKAKQLLDYDVDGYSAFENAYVDYEMDESDEEADLSKMDQGTSANRRNKLTRWDFDTEEEWDRYNASIEKVPKAAFQFGIKKDDGRKTKRQKDKKLDNQLKQIEGLIKKRQAEGTKAYPQPPPHKKTRNKPNE